MSEANTRLDKYSEYFQSDGDGISVRRDFIYRLFAKLVIQGKEQDEKAMDQRKMRAIS